LITGKKEGVKKRERSSRTKSHLDGVAPTYVRREKRSSKKKEGEGKTTAEGRTSTPQGFGGKTRIELRNKRRSFSQTKNESDLGEPARSREEIKSKKRPGRERKEGNGTQVCPGGVAEKVDSSGGKG